MSDAEVIGTGKWHIPRDTKGNPMPDRHGQLIQRRVGWCDRWGRREDIIIETVPALELKSVEREYPGR